MAPPGNKDAARHDLEEDHMKRSLFLLAGLTLLPAMAQAKTEISWWHAMTGANAEVVDKIAGDFNASQSDYELKPVFKGTYPETLNAGIAAFRRQALADVGYWSPDMITEDIDISWKLQLRHWDIFFEPRALCWILMPETLKGLWKQRLRWAQGGAEVLRIEFSEPQTELPTGFAVQTPARIALDFPGVTNASGRSLVEINQGNVKSAHIVEAGERSRIVLNLKQATTYRAELHGKAVLVLLDSVTSAARVPAGPSAVFAEGHNADVLPLKDLDFRRGSDGAGRIVVGLANNQVGVDLKTQGKGLVVEFQRASLPEGLRRRLDVSDFGTPVQTITAAQQGERVRLTIDPVGDWEHSAYQSDNQFVVEVRPKKVDLSKLTQGPNYSGEKLSLNFQNIEVRSLLQVIADFTNFNIVTSDTVTGALTLRLKDVPWDQALDIIMQAKGLGVRKTGNVLWIAPKDEIYTKEKLDLEAKKQIQDLEPLRTQSFQLNYAKAEEIAKRKLSFAQRALMKAGSLAGVTDSSDAIQNLSRLWMPLGKRVAIIGGGLVGLELAEFLVDRGRQVTVLEPGTHAGTELPIVRRWRVIEAVQDHGQLHLQAQVQRIERKQVVWLNKKGEGQSTEADSVVLALGAEPDARVAEQLQALTSLPVRRLGDSAALGYIEGAMHSGHHAGRTI